MNISIFMNKRDLGGKDNLFPDELQTSGRLIAHEDLDTMMENLGITKYVFIDVLLLSGMLREE